MAKLISGSTPHWRGVLVRTMLALLLLCAVGTATAGDQPATAPGTATAAAAEAATSAAQGSRVERTAFDHLTTGFELIGKHRDLPCESCHYNAVFKGTPRDCASCHGLGTQVRATAKPLAHILSSSRCESCHTPVAFSPAVNFDHAEVRGSCSSCHNNIQAQGKGPTHIETTLECDACHSTFNWAGALFNHLGVISGCATCHNGVSASGTPVTHMPTDGAACELCHIPTQYTSFSGAQMNHAAVTPPMPCADCHEAGKSFVGVTMVTRPAAPHPTTGDCGSCHLSTISFGSGALQPADHIPTSQPCTLCHSNPADFSVYVMKHDGISSGCAECHAADRSFANMAPPVLKVPPVNHIPIGSASCESCHSASTFTSFAISNKSPPMNHAAVPGVACATCHGAGASWVGTPATVLPPANHVPVGATGCEACHSSSNFGSFMFANASGAAPPAMVHSAVSASACSSCHEVGNSWVGAPATVLRPATKADGSAHVASGECSTCHVNTTSFKGAADLPSDHIPLPAADGSNCVLCHTTAGDYTIAAMNHVNIASNCAQCHALGKSFANMAPPTLKLPPANHIPVGSASCESCHSATTFSSFVISNKSPPMSHAAVPGVACATCHATGSSWAGTPATVLPPGNHIPIGSADCQSCHAPGTFSTFLFANLSGTAPPSMVHSAVSSTACSACHEAGQSWAGAPGTKLRPATKADGSAHVATGECSTCHFNTTSFKGATDLPSNHIPLPSGASNLCASCHSNAKDYSSYTMDHTVVSAAACAVCHAADKSFANMAPPTLKVPPGTHIPIGSASCEGCHSPTNFSSFVISNKSPPMNHAVVSGVACSTCHATGSSWVGTPATVLPPGNHIPIGSADCEGCHAPGTFSTFLFANLSGTAPPSMVHSVVSSIVCSACHEGGHSWAGAPGTKLRPATKSDGSPHVATGECSTCHFSTTSFKGATDLPSNHIPLPAADNNSCALCHTTAGDYTVAVMNHANIANNCAQCHALGLSFANMAPPALKLPPGNHVPIGTASCEGCHSATNFSSFVISNKSPPMNHAMVSGVACSTCHATGSSWVGTPSTVLPPGNHIPVGGADCEGCHAPGTFSTFLFANLSGTAPPSMVHSVVSSIVCSACHEAGHSWAGAPGTKLRPATKADGSAHVTSGECSTCHFSTTSFKSATDLPSNHIPLPAADNNSCVLCHTTAGDYTVAVMNHVNIASNCAQCHALGLSFANMAPPALKLPPGNHVPIGTASCEGCHSATNFTSFVISNKSPPMNHAVVSGLPCSSCHAAGSSWVGTPATVLSPANHIPFGTATCDSCHAPGTFTSFMFSNLSGTAPPAMVHSAVSAMLCSDCHEAGRSWAGAPGTKLRPATKSDGSPHVASGECSTCHFNTTSFKGATDLPSNHIPLPAADNNGCVLCHTTAGDYTVAVMNHVNIASNCSQCHGAGKSFANMAPPTLKLAPANHIPIGSASCESCHSATTFTSFVISNKVPPMNHAVVSGVPCSTCHAAGASWVGTPMTVLPPANHVPFGSADCESCHAPGTFSSFMFSNASGMAPPAMVHSVVSSIACSACHEAGHSWAGAPATKLRPATKADGSAHVAAGECSTCHFNTTSFKGAIDLPSNHIPLPSGSSSPCVSCHTNAADYSSYTMNHTVVSTTACAVCHAADKSFANMAPPVLKVPPGNHIPIGTASCESCHSATNFASFTISNRSPPMNHAAVTALSCAGCHGSGLSFVGAPPVVTLPPTHVPVGTADCALCHGNSSFNAFSFANLSGTAPPAMVHSAVSAAACSSCHERGSTWIGAPATVVRPATKADGSAHVASGECSTCHFSTTSFKTATDLPSNHIPLPAADNNSCVLCHTTAGDYTVAVMNHVNIASNCSQCHGAGKNFANMAPPTLKLPPANHVPIGSASCESCHVASSFTSFVISNKSPPMNHAAVPGVACATCHAAGSSWVGTPATVLPPANHIPFGSAACESCHAPGTFSSFTFSNLSGTAPAAMVHSAVSAMVCSDCHEAGHSWAGTPATKLRPAIKADGTAHVATGECSTCHFNTTSFKGATDLPSNHIPLPAADNNSCVLCHTTAGNFTVAVMNHVNIASNCSQCHGAGKSFANMAPPILKLPPGNHVPIGSASCESCHSATSFNSFVISNKSPPMNHAAVPGVACATCHAAGSGWVGTPATVLPPANHIPFGSAACESCHAPGTFSSFTFSNLSGTAPPAMVHSSVSAMVCSDCHEAGHSWAGAPATKLRPATKADGTAHVATGECSTCHFNTTSFKGATDLPSNHIPLPAADNNSCVLCHTTAGNFTVAVMNHVNIASNCSQCHGAGKSFANMAPPTLKLAPANHIPYGSAACESCHAAGTFTSFVISNKSPPMNHAVVASQACSACHAAGMSFVGTPATVVEPGNHIPIGATACTSCHSATNFASFTIANAVPPMNHAGFTTSCVTCHGVGQSWIGTPAVKTLPATHIPTGSMACEGCHSNSSFSSFSFVNASGTAPAAMVHSLVTAIVCSTCHEAGKTFIGAPATKVRPAKKADGTAHVASGECSTCHFNTTSFKGATDLPANHIPLPAADNNSCVLCHTTAGNYSVAVMNHANIASNCSQCHGAGKSFANMAPPTLKLAPANHIPYGSAACESCHAAGTFTTFVISNKSPPMNHAVVASQACSACHAAGKTFAGTPATVVEPGNHIPIGSVVCTQCHTPSNFASFAFTNASGTAPPKMVHTGFTTGCVNCHGAGKTFVGTPATKVLPATHIPTATIACEGCHSASNFTSFVISNVSGTAPPSMVHSLVTALLCSSCHEAGKTFIGSPAIKVRPAKKADGTAHVASGECSTCHFNTTSFKGATDLPANHIPLPAADGNSCVLCHTTAGNYSLATMNHVNITTNCTQCHAYGLSFANMGAPTLKSPPAGATGHIPSNPPNGTANIACELCHTATVFTTFSGTIMKHAAVRAMTCMSCHEIGMTWKTNTGVRLWVRDSANHHKGVDCGGSGCHSTRDKFGARRGSVVPANQKSGTAGGTPTLGGASSLGHATGFNHRRVLGTACISCHAPASGLGKSATHIATSDSCDSCHTTLAWMPVSSVDHLQVRGACSTCHNATLARGKGSNHIASDNRCESCHTSNAWTPARFEHSSVAAHSCKSCHNGLQATGLPINHVPTSAQCDTCHGTLGWKPALLDHTTLTASCVSCHNNSVTLGVTPTHMNTRVDCATCHTYPDWALLHFVHTATAYPGAHRAPLACAACHTSNSDQIPWPSMANAASCGGCHAAQFQPSAHPKTSGALKYTANELHDCTGACHVYSDATLGTVVKSQPGNYHRVGDAAFKH